MQRYLPVAPSGHKSTFDSLRFRSGPAHRTVETDQKILMVSTLARKIAAQTAVLADGALNDGRALKGIERKASVADRHQTLRCCTTRFVCWRNRSNPATLETLPGQYPTRLQPLAQIPFASGNQRNQRERTSDLGNNPGHMKIYLAHIPHNSVYK
jgi:hypothetical protein